MLDTVIVNELLSSVDANGPTVVGATVGWVWGLTPCISPSTFLNTSPIENVESDGAGENDILSIETLVTGNTIGCVNWVASALNISPSVYPFPPLETETSLTTPRLPIVNSKSVVGVP